MNFSLKTLALICLMAAAVLAQSGGEPSWPQNFQVPQGESRGFGFVVTQPGPIIVNVTSQGSPIVLSLFGPFPQPLTRAGSGNLSLSYNATPADVQKSAFWVVSITANVAPPVLRSISQVVAAGSIVVQHPPADLRLVQPEFQNRTRATRLAAIPVSPAALQTVSPKQAAYMNQRATQQAAMRQALIGQIRPIPNAARMTPQPTAPSIRTSGGPNSGQSGGSAGAPSGPPPQILSLSASKGTPGDTLLINGSGFGTQSEVHFIVTGGNPGTDVLDPQPQTYSESQIVATVPAVQGIPGFKGFLYIKNSNGRSQLVPFEFVPVAQYVQLDLTMEQALQPGGGQVKYVGPGKCMLLGSAGPPDPGSCVDHSVAPDMGSALTYHSNDDQFFPFFQLKNGWVTDSVELRTDSGPGGGAYIADKREGTASPFAKIHWWVNPLGEMQYTLTVTVVGPSGMPYR